MKNYLHPIRLQGLEIPCNLLLAPLAGFTDPPFRHICVSRGACFTFTEMVSAEGLVRGSRKTQFLLTRAQNEKLLGVQLFAADPRTAGEAARLTLRYDPSLIDLNCGCPVPKVIKTGAGAALSMDPSRIGDIVRSIKKALLGEGAPVPVSVKLRSGWDSSSITYLDCAAAAVNAGADMLTLHPRSRSQGYSGTANWEYIRELKQKVTVPVIGSGDLFSPMDAKRMFDDTGCDGVMFARGVLGNPFIFEESKIFLASGKMPPSAGAELKLTTAWEHYARSRELLGEKLAAKEMKKHFCSYTKGLQGGAALRKEFVHALTAEDFKRIIDEYLKNYCARSPL